MGNDKNIGNLVYGAKLDTKEFRKGSEDLAKTAQKTDKTIQKNTKGVNDLNKGMKKGAEEAKGFGSALKKYLTFGAIILAVKKFTTAIFKLGSDLEEIQSKFNVVFGELQDRANKAFEDLALQTNRSSLDLKRFGSNLGDVLKPLGFTSDEAFRLSENMTKLAIDVASFNNVTDDQAVNAFRSALTGEREALKSLGIVITEADLKTEAYTAGIAKQGSELTKQQKALATYNLLLANSADAQGDAVRTGESFANQLKGLRGAIQDVLASTGRDVAQETAGVLKTLSNFVKTYAKDLISVTIDTGKTIIGVLNQAVKGFTDLFNKLDGRAEESNKRQMGFLDIFAIGLQSALLALKAFVVGGVALIESLGIIFGDVISGIVNGAGDGAKIIGNTFKALGIAVAGSFVLLGDKVVGSIKGIANGAIRAINFLVRGVNKLPKVDIPLINELENATNNSASFESAFKNTLGDIGRNIKSFNSNVDFSTTFTDAKKKITDATSEIGDDFLNLGASIITNSEKIEGANKDTAGSFDDLADVVDKYANSQDKANEKAGEGADSAEEAQKAIEDIAKEYDKWQDGLEKTEEKMEKLRDKTDEFMKDIRDSIREVTNELGNLQETFASDVAGDVVDAEKKLKDLREELKGEDLSDERKKDIQDQIKEQEKLIATANQLIADGKLGEEDLIEARRKASLNSIEARAEQYEAEKAILEERQALLEQLQEGEEIQLEEIKDFKNRVFIEELLAKKEQIEKEIELVQEEQVAIQNAWIAGASAIEAINDQLIATLDAKYQALAQRIRSALESARNAGGGGSAQIGGQFQSGGFTGAGQTNDIAGVVHRGEFVANARMVRDNKALFQALDKMQRKGYQEGGIVNNNQRTLTVNPTVNHRVGLRAVMKEIRYHLR